jgi:hypothetical protein
MAVGISNIVKLAMIKKFTTLLVDFFAGLQKKIMILHKDLYIHKKDTYFWHFYRIGVFSFYRNKVCIQPVDYIHYILLYLLVTS